MKRLILSSIVFFSIFACTNKANNSSIKVEGKMSDVMKRGELEGKISTDTLNTINAYGLGPLEFLQGEILLFEGKTYVSRVIDSSSHKVEQVTSASAPFLVYSTQSDLQTVDLPSGIYSLKGLEHFIDSAYQSYKRPLLIRIDGEFEQIEVHSVNLPKGSKVSSPKEAHQGLTKYNYSKVSGSLIGFFSRKHQAVFTHHDSYFHAHFISDDRKILGHVDMLNLNSDAVKIKVSK